VNLRIAIDYDRTAAAALAIEEFDLEFEFGYHPVEPVQTVV